MNLKNKKVLITGATGGIGNSLLQKFNDLGASILATGTNEEKLANIKKNYPKVEVESFKLQEHDKIEKFIEDNFLESLKYFEKKNKVKINISSDQQLTPSEYKVNFQSKTKKTIEKIENLFETLYRKELTIIHSKK